jgi:hypothetical protein
MLRHACGFALAGKGHDTRALQAYLGHKNIQHTVRYTELAPTASKTSGANRSRCRALEEGGQDCGANQHKTTCHRGNDERGLDLVHGCYPHHPESNTIGRCENSFSDLGHRAHRILWITCPVPLRAPDSTPFEGDLVPARIPAGSTCSSRRPSERGRGQLRLLHAGSSRPRCDASGRAALPADGCPPTDQPNKRMGEFAKTPRCRRSTGDMVTHERKEGEDAEAWAGILKQFRQHIHGDRKPGFSGPLRYPCTSGVSSPAGKKPLLR